MSGNRSARNKNSLQDFDPRKLGKVDQFSFDLKTKDELVGFNFIVFIVQLRFYASLGGVKFTGENFDEKLCLGDADSYRNPFMVVSVSFDGCYEVGFLVYKPNVYNVGFCINGQWWRVKDFSTVTNYTFTDSKLLLYNSSYVRVPDRYSFYIFQNSIINVFNSFDRVSYNSLCVILCETMRSNEILRVVAGSLGKDKNGVRKVVTLNATHMEIILKWNHTCGLWYLYDLGFKWDPLGKYPELIFQDAESCSKSLALAMKTEKKFADYIEDLRKLTREEFRKRKIMRRPIPLKGFEQHNADFEEDLADFEEDHASKEE